MEFSRTRSRPLKRPLRKATTVAKPVVLVVDDDEGIRSALELLLREKYDVQLCATGHKGIKSVNNETRAVVLDVKMPGKDGFQVCKEIKMKYPELPIIFYSAFDDLSERVQFRKKYRPYSYFEKTGNIKELLEGIDKAVKHYENVIKMLETRRRLEEFNKQL